LAVAVLSLCLLIQATAWYAIVRLLGGRVGVVTALWAYGVTLLPRYVPGSVWGYTSRVLLLERRGVPARLSVASTVLEVALIVGSGALAALFALYRVIPPPAYWLVLAGLFIIAGFGLVVLSRRYAAQTAPRAHTHSLLRLTLSQSFAAWLALGLVYVTFWVLYGMSTWLVAESLAPGACGNCFVEVVSGAALAWLGGFLVLFVPGGLGVREVALTLLLSPTLGAAEAALVALLARLAGMVAEVAFSAFSVVLQSLFREKEAEKP
jgi:uncharacterized membrane protein YbhN (UPF0104 family)